MSPETSLSIGREAARPLGPGDAAQRATTKFIEIGVYASTRRVSPVTLPRASLGVPPHIVVRFPWKDAPVSAVLW